MAIGDDYLLGENDETGDQLTYVEDGNGIDIDNVHIRKLRKHIPCCIVLADQIFPAMMSDKRYCPIKIAWEKQLILHRHEVPSLPKEFTDFLKEKGLYEKFSQYLINELGYQEVEGSALNDPTFIGHFWRVLDEAAGEIRGLAKYEQPRQNPYRKSQLKKPPTSKPSSMTIPTPYPIEPEGTDQMHTLFGKRKVRNLNSQEKEALRLTESLLKGLENIEQEILFGNIHRFSKEYVTRGHSKLVLRPNLITRLSRFNVKQDLLPRELVIDSVKKEAHYKGRVYTLSELGGKLLQLLSTIIYLPGQEEMEP